MSQVIYKELPNSDLSTIKFFTEAKEALQIGIMSRPQGYKVKPHYHNSTQEVLYVISGLVKINTDDSEVYLCDGDLIHLTEGVHSLEFLKPSQVLEVKQGPHKDDKVYV